MNYSLLQGGKRIRPILTKAVLESMNMDASLYKEFLCALECIHSVFISCMMTRTG